MRRYITEDSEFSEINITPFTDVVLVLLLIFMITSPFILSSVFKVTLPTVTNSDTASSQKIEIFVNDQNQYFYDNKQITLVELQTQMQLEFMKNGISEIIVKADKNSRHGSVVQLIDVLKSAGATKFLIGTVKSSQ